MLFDHPVFSNEMILNLDGLDGVNHQWHDLKKEKSLAPPAVEGGGITVWTAFKKGANNAFVEV